MPQVSVTTLPHEIAAKYDTELAAARALIESFLARSENRIDAVRNLAALDSMICEARTPVTLEHFGD